MTTLLDENIKFSVEVYIIHIMSLVFSKEFTSTAC